MNIKRLIEELQNLLETYETIQDNTTLLATDKLYKGYNGLYNPNKGTRGTYNDKIITSRIGKRSVAKGSKVHRGLDLAYSYGETVYAFCSGEVTYAKPMNGFGRLVIITDSNGYQHLYAHLSSLDVKDKQHISKGQAIGKAGDSDYRNGVLINNGYPTHLHYGIWLPRGIDNKAAIDPRTYIYP